MDILRQLRERTSLTLRQVEDATGISNSYLSQLENGKIKTPSAQSLYVLSRLYNTNVEDLLIAAGLVKEVNIEPFEIKPSIEERLNTLEEKVNQMYTNHINFS